MKKRIFPLLLALGLCVTTVWAEDETYLDVDGTTRPFPNGCQIVTNSTTGDIWEAGWYVVKEDVTINGQVVIKGAANLILCDGATLTVKTNDTVPITFYRVGAFNGSLTVYGQANQSGILKTEIKQTGTGIHGSITVNSGIVMAHGGSPGTGIYGNVTVNGGRVEAYGKYQLGINGSVTVTGGTVIAECDFDGGGIDGNVTLPDSYKWRTDKNEAFTKSSATAYSNESKPRYVEIVACHALGDWVDEVPATCTEPGTVGYKTCSICDKHFDASGVEITDTTIEKDPSNHAGDGVWHSDRKTHWMTYDACCGIATAAEAHSFDGRTCVPSAAIKSPSPVAAPPQQ